MTVNRRERTPASPGRAAVAHASERSRSGSRIAVVVLLLLVVALFADVLFAGRSVLLSQYGTDISRHFSRWRQFGFDEMRQGRFPLWNPHLFCGLPYFGGFQAALLYPPNLLHLILDNTVAINWLIVAHVFFSGLWTYAWARGRGLSWAGGLLAAVVFMFCGAQFLRIYAGHLPIIYSTPWIPLLFWSLDRYFEDRSLGSWLVGAFSLTMQVLAGHPQTVFYTLVAAGLYVALGLVKARRRMRLAAGMATLLLCAGLLTAVQTFSGADVARESVRSGGVSYEFAASFSFAPENLLTLLSPGCFGDNVHLPYWGRCMLWEMCVFMGVAGLVLAIYGAVRGPKEQRRFLAPLALVLLLLALGARTPLFRLLYHYVPGFDDFRGNCKFTLEASLFLALLAGVGADRLVLARAAVARWRPVGLAALVAAAAALSGAAGLGVYLAARGPDAWWQGLVRKIASSQESYCPSAYYSDPAFLSRAGTFAAEGLFVAAGTLALLACLLLLIRYAKWCAYLPLGLALIELLVFARMNRATYDPSIRGRGIAEIGDFLRSKPGDYRILSLADPNAAMSMNADDIWGYDPGLLLRYGQFISFTQGQDPDVADMYVRFTAIPPLYSMLRLGYVLVPANGGVEIRGTDADPMPRLHLLTEYAVAAKRDEILALMSEPSFDPRRRVILETPPDPPPAPSSSGPGSAVVVDSSTDHLTIEADLAQPAILLVTDAYSRGWRARPLPGSVQSRYEVMPANYVLRAVPLGAGHHRFRMEYAPRAFRVGVWISGVSLLAYVALLLWWTRTSRKAPCSRERVLRVVRDGDSPAQPG